MEKSSKRTVLIGAAVLALAVVAGVLVMVLTSPRSAKPEPSPELTPEPAVTVAAAPTPTPEVTAIRLYAFGRELTADGITLYVGDKPVELSAVIEPEGLNLPVGWTFSNQEAVSLEVSGDGMTCTITALQPKGRNDLTVVCSNLYTSIPVFLWSK